MSPSRMLVPWFVIALAACGKGNTENQGAMPAVAESAPAVVPQAAPAPVPAPAPAPTAAVNAQKVELAIATVASTMVFDKTTLTVPTGAQVHLVVKNAEPGALSHNWVLVKPGSEASVAAAGLAKGAAANYIDPSNTDVLAYTPLAPPGKDAEVTFTAPAAGTYPYICSFPGHYMMMKGTLTVTP